MEKIKIKNISSRVVLEKADNGIILYDISEDNTVSSKLIFETYFKDGVLDFENIAGIFVEVMDIMRIPLSEPETNRMFKLSIEKIDPDKPALGEEDGIDDD